MKNKTIGNIFPVLNWLFGILFFIAGIGSFEYSSLNVILYWSISCLLLPPVRKYTYTITKINISVGVRGLIIFLLLIFTGNTTKEAPDEMDLETNNEICQANNNRVSPQNACNILADIKLNSRNEWKSTHHDSNIYYCLSDSLSVVDSEYNKISFYVEGTNCLLNSAHIKASIQPNIEGATNYYNSLLKEQELEAIDEFVKIANLFVSRFTGCKGSYNIDAKIKKAKNTAKDSTQTEQICGNTILFTRVEYSNEYYELKLVIKNP